MTQTERSKGVGPVGRGGGVQNREGRERGGGGLGQHRDGKLNILRLLDLGRPVSCSSNNTQMTQKEV